MVWGHPIIEIDFGDTFHDFKDNFLNFTVTSAQANHLFTRFYIFGAGYATALPCHDGITRGLN